MNEFEPPVWMAPPPVLPVRRRGPRAAAVAGLLGAGVTVGAVLTFGLNANASPSTTAPGSAAAATSTSGPRPDRPFGPRLSGTVTAVDTAASTVTIETSTATTTYAVDANSDIDKNGEANLAALRVGDAVTFSTVTTNSKATIAVLHSGDEAKNRPAGGFGGHGPHALALSGTVTAVDTTASTVTIKTSTTTTTYAVDANSDIDKNGEANLAALRVGDAVTFSTVTTNSKATIAVLHSGDEAKNRPAGGFGGHGDGPGSGSA